VTLAQPDVAVSRPSDATAQALTATRGLVLCADDYALHAGVTEAVLDLARAARLSATSAMVLSPRWADDAAPLRELRGQVDVGLHLDWTSDFALAAGHGTSLTTQMRRALWHAVWPITAPEREAVRVVIERQLDAFEQHWQAAPDHVDGHQHVQQFAGIREVLVEVLQRRYGHAAVRPWLRLSQVAQPGLKARIITALGANALRDWTARHDWPQCSPLRGAYDFDAREGVYERHMARWLAQGPGLLMCHPATHAPADDAIGAARVREWAHLRSDAFAKALREAGVCLRRGPATADCTDNPQPT